MSDLTDYYENQIMQHSFGGTDMPPAPTTVYIALHTDAPSESGDANELDPGTTNYEREAVDPANFTINGNSVENNSEIGFPTADGAWGLITHISVWDGATDTDNALWQTAVDNPKDIEAQDTLVFGAGTITATID